MDSPYNYSNHLHTFNYGLYATCAILNYQTSFPPMRRPLRSRDINDSGISDSSSPRSDVSTWTVGGRTELLTPPSSEAESETKKSSTESKSYRNKKNKFKLHRCKKCGFTSQTIEKLWDHKRNVHYDKNKTLCCIYCQFCTMHKHHLEYHLKSSHTKEKPYKCEVVGCPYEGAVNKSMLASHRKSHSPFCEFRCRDCNYECKTLNIMKRHAREKRHEPLRKPNQIIDVYGNRREPRTNQTQKQQRAPLVAEPEQKPSLALLPRQQAVPLSLEHLQLLQQENQKLIIQYLLLMNKLVEDHQNGKTAEDQHEPEDESMSEQEEPLDLRKSSSDVNREESPALKSAEELRRSLTSPPLGSTSESSLSNESSGINLYNIYNPGFDTSFGSFQSENNSFSRSSGTPLSSSFAGLNLREEPVAGPSRLETPDFRFSESLRSYDGLSPPFSDLIKEECPAYKSPEYLSVNSRSSTPLSALNREDSSVFKTPVSVKSCDWHETQQMEDGDVKPPTNPPLMKKGKRKDYRCKKCEFVSLVKDEFWTHKRIHIDPKKLLECTRCTFVTDLRHHFDYHVKKHKGEKPFKCIVEGCPYAGITKSTLVSHLKSHSDINLFFCDDCDYSSKALTTYKSHLRKYNHKPTPGMCIDIYGKKRGPRNQNKTPSSQALVLSQPAFPSNSMTPDMQTIMKKNVIIEEIQSMLQQALASRDAAESDEMTTESQAENVQL